MDSAVMEQRIKQWMLILEEQAKSGLNKQDWCQQNGIKRAAFFKWQRECRAYLLSKQKRPSSIEEPTFIEISCEKEATNLVTLPAKNDASSCQSSIVISCNEFSISIMGQVDESNLAKVLKVVSYVH